MKLYRYFHTLDDPFANITEVHLDNPEAYIDYIRSKNLPCSKTYDTAYVSRRLSTEQSLRDQFIEKGGKPELKHPYYMTLGNCDFWFFRIKHCIGSLAILLSDFSPDTISFTYGDSIPTFDRTFYNGKEYNMQVYTVEGIKEIVAKYGMPQVWNKNSKFSPEAYIEAQIWSDKIINLYRPLYVLPEKFSQHCSAISTAIIRANIYMDECALETMSVFELVARIQRSPFRIYFESAINALDFNDFPQDNIHGIPHAIKCAILIFGMGMIDNVSENLMKCLIYSALYHDVGRKHIKEHTYHSEVSSMLIPKLLPSISAKKQNFIQSVIRNHDKIVESNVQTISEYNMDSINHTKAINWLKDSDSLDYIRFGPADYNTRYLRTKEGKQLIRAAIELNLLHYRYPDRFYHLVNSIFINEKEWNR